jgi:hypothetical protein
VTPSELQAPAADEGAKAPPALRTVPRFIEDFEALRVAPESFGHARHVELAWLYLQTFATDEARARFCAALQRFAAHVGVPHKYDAQLTDAWLARIATHLSQDESWDGFAARHPELLDKHLLRPHAKDPPAVS